MDRLFPKKNPEAAKKLLETPDEKLTNIERQKKFTLAVAMTPMPCPMCFERVSIVEAADDTLEIGGDDYNGEYICPSCATELAKVVPFFLQPGTPGWHWQRKRPIPGKKNNDGRLFSSQELELLVAEHDTITLLVGGARSGSDPATAASVSADALRLVTPNRLDNYLRAHGWALDDASSDNVRRTWRKTDGGVCHIHTNCDAEFMAKDIESVALGENCSVLRVLVRLLALGPYM